MEPTNSLSFNPSDPDAPLLALMSVGSNPDLITEMPEDKLRELVQRLRSYNLPQTLNAKIDSEKPKRERAPSVNAAKKQKLNSILDDL